MRLLPLAALLFAASAQAAEPITMDVHRDANCGCCKAWISHLEDNGIKVNDHVETDMAAVKQRLGVPPRLASCHTGVIDGKFVRVMAWYDNEWGFSSRMADTTIAMAKLM